MSLRLVSIAFNYPAPPNVKCTINIRRDAHRRVQVPEWLRTLSEVRNDPAAYAIEKVQQDLSNLIIRVSLVSTDANIQAANVRGISRHASPQDFLGDVAARQVEFPQAGVPVTADFNLSNSQLRALGVNIYNVMWDWQFSLTGNAGDFHDFDTSEHKIYAARARPTRPWVQNPAGSDQLPWAKVLDWACLWAQGAQDVDEAATLITLNVFNLGRIMVDIDGHDELTPLIEYDCPNDGGSHYVNTEEFYCVSFLRRLGREPSRGPFVNCDDCAAIVSTFANILGCDLSQATMGLHNTGTFDLNPVILIGAPQGGWKIGCPGTIESFSHHTVAWKGGAAWRDEIYDACLIVDGDSDPEGPPNSPHIELHPTNIRFGRVTDRGYRFRLASGPRANRAKCAPNRDPDRKSVV